MVSIVGPPTIYPQLGKSAIHHELTGIFSMSLLLIPIVIVVVLLGQEPHAP